MYECITFTIKGIVPLLMHSAKLADPLSPYSQGMRKITNKKAKDRTDDDLLELARLEWFGGLYYDAEKGPIIPGVNIEAMLNRAARAQRKGKTAQAGLMSDDDWALQYEGTRDADQMWESGKFRDTRPAKPQGKGTVMRTRPIFRNWGVTFKVMFDTEMMNRKQIVELVEHAGRYVGLCDYLPRFGRFEVVKAE